MEPNHHPHRFSPARKVSLAACAITIAWGGPTLAAGPLPAEGQIIETSEYRIDMYQGPILSSARSTGLGGSTAAIAEGVDGLPVNAAAPAVRAPWSVDYYDYDVGIGFTTASALNQTDFDNNGRIAFDDGTNRGDTSYERFLFATIGATFQWGKWGVGLSVDSQNYRLGEMPIVPDAPPNLQVTLSRANVLVARSYWDQSLVVGVGLRGATLDINATENVNGSGQKVRLVEMTGGGLQCGFVYASPTLPMRLGLTWRSRVRGVTKEGSRAQTTPEGDTIIGNRYLPTEVALPWEVEAGIAYQFGPRPLNVHWIDPHQEVEQYARKLRAKLPAPQDPSYEAREQELDRQIEAHEERVRRRLKARYANTSRQKVLVSASLLVAGPIDEGVGIESFLRQRVERSGRWVTLQPRLGVEIEPVENELQVRVGSYVEPSRFDQHIVRAHGTAGFDFRILEWSVFSLFDEDTSWRVGAVVDGAQRYLSIGLSAGIWH